MRALAARLVSDELVMFPVRHHSPACALHLQRFLTGCRPSVVLIEGPRSFTKLVPLLAHTQATAPLAIYTYAVFNRGKALGVESPQLNRDVEATRRSAYFPFCDYSPELVALREATRQGVPVRFIDLDFSEQSQLKPDQEDDQATSLLNEERYKRSAYLGRIAERLGCRDQEELWEHLFERGAAALTMAQHIEQVATYAYLARQETSAAEMAADGTCHREAEMAWHVKEALTQRKSHEGPVVAVLGAFHAVVMPELLDRPLARPVLSKMPIGDESSTLIRYSFDRLDRLNGYSAGMTSPAWHQRIWEGLKKLDGTGQLDDSRSRRESALQTISDIALELREKHQFELPMPTIGSAFEQTLRLAALRGRPAPLRNDIMDGVRSCFIQGDAESDGKVVSAVAQRVLSGCALGRVPVGAGVPPMVKDFEVQANRQRLKLEGGEPRRVVLDIYRQPEHRVTSRLLHGLGLLGVPFAARSAGPDFINGVGLERIKEHWSYIYTPQTEAALVEASVYGVTLRLAVANRFVNRLEQMSAEGKGRDARAAANALAQGCVLGLHDQLAQVLTHLRFAISGDSRLTGVTSAAMTIGLLWESREPLEASALEELPIVLRAAYERAIFLGCSLQDPGDDEAGVLQSLAQIRELLHSSAGRSLDASLYWEMLDSLFRQHGFAVIRGVCAGHLYAGGKLEAADLGAALNGHLGGGAARSDAVSFLRGMLCSARETAWQQPEVIQVIDQLLGQWEEKVFVSHLPELRLAFAEMTPRETDRIAKVVSDLHGKQDIGTLVQRQINGSQLHANLALSQLVREVLVADGLTWGAM